MTDRLANEIQDRVPSRFNARLACRRIPKTEYATSETEGLGILHLARRELRNAQTTRSTVQVGCISQGREPKT